ncbi:MAG TPA: PDZ domain-containing protein [Pyrinomonadaceae bacterium]|nr:PDZ domain-containing protein [Pyrinomonadaceae bacterium]
MRLSRLHCVIAFFLFFALIINASASSAQTTQQPARRQSNNTSQPAPDIHFTVSMPQPHTHLLEVEMRVRWNTSAPASVDLVMPVWTPGSYLVREYARHVQDFAAKDEGGKSLQWRKANKNTWRVTTGDATGGARSVIATYRVYANELTVRTNELNDRHAFWNNAALLMHPSGHLAAPATLRVSPFKAEWKIATGLPAVAGESNTFRAENFDVLYDSPFLVSDFKELRFDVRGVAHRIVIDGAGNYDAEAVRRDTQRIVEAAVAMMGDVPYRDYTFQLMLHPTTRGGLEHLNSTALIWRRFGFRPEADYRDFLTLVAHEYFHLWNVKRIRPDALGPFDYTGENYTRLLWVAEGGTSYYENILVRRANLMTVRQYLDSIAKSFQDLQNAPGRREMSLEESSFDAWIKYYRPDENTINSSISYYDKGAIVSLLLDLRIRQLTSGARSLDDVMRRLYSEYAKKNRNYTPEDFQREAEQVAGASLDDFFRRYVRGTEELDYDAALATVGLRLDTTGGDKTLPKAYLGATFALAGEQILGRDAPAGALTIKTVPAGTAAYEQGLNVGDQIVAVDGVRATSDFLTARLAEKRPGDTVALTVFRFDELRTFDVKLGAQSEGTYRIVPVSAPSAEQKKLFQDWLGALFPQTTGARAATL